MFVLEVEYLLGRAIAARHDDRRTVEWPPHPVRLFAALAAAFHESDLAEKSHPQHETAEGALYWLERQDAPSLAADPPDAGPWGRDVWMQFVPRNDTNDQLNNEGKRHPSITRDIPLGRARADQRWFPGFAPTDPVVRFVWPEADLSGDLRQGLSALAQRVTYVGHSMSPVRVALTETVTAVTLRPDGNGDMSLRTMGEGRLNHLREIYAQRIKNSSIQPRLGRVTRYAAREDEIRVVKRSLFRRWLAFRRVDGPRLPLESTAGLVDLIRRAVLDRYPDPLPEWVSGHSPEGTPSRRPHMAIIPLPDVGHRHAGGNLLGFALLAPDDVPDEEWTTLEDALYDFDALLLGAAGNWRIASVSGAGHVAAALRPATWRSRAKTWASVTPVVFGHFPKPRPGKDALAVLGAACHAIGLPAPIETRFGPVSALSGVPHAADFVYGSHAKGKLIAHVWLRFSEPVRGPLLVGAGRFAGFGLLRPWKAQKERQ